MTEDTLMLSELIKKINEIQDRQDQLFKKVENIEGLQLVIVRKYLAHSKKVELLREQVMKTGRMTSGQAEHYLGCSRNWAISLLKKLGKEPGFQYTEGMDKSPSRLIFSASKIISDKFAKLKGLIDSKGPLTFSDVIGRFGYDLPNTRQFLEEFCQHENMVNGKKLYEINDVKIQKIKNA